MSPELESRAKKLQERIREKSQEELAQELQKQLNSRFSELVSVITSLNQQQYKRAASTAEIIWQEGSTSLYSFPSNPERTVIFIPSLINRSYILDLTEKRSFMRYLQKQGINSYLVDWGEPEASETEFNLDDYIATRLDKIISHVTQTTGKPVILAGYCMGGLMAIASTLRNNDKVKGLALFATPWDFHSPNYARFDLNDDAVSILKNIIQASSKLPAHLIQSMFYYLHPESVKHKFDHVSAFIGDEAADIEEFMAVEQWVNDGISMTRNVAKECFIDWVHHNQIMKGKWQVAGNIIDPASIRIPCFIVTSQKDHIVPPDCSAPLIVLLRNKKVITNDMGHISMVAGAKARDNVWRPFEEWVTTI